MFLVLCGNSNLDVLINFVLIKKKKCLLQYFWLLGIPPPTQETVDYNVSTDREKLSQMVYNIQTKLLTKAYSLMPIRVAHVLGLSLATMHSIVYRKFYYKRKFTKCPSHIFINNKANQLLNHQLLPGDICNPYSLFPWTQFPSQEKFKICIEN